MTDEVEEPGRPLGSSKASVLKSWPEYVFEALVGRRA